LAEFGFALADFGFSRLSSVFDTRIGYVRFVARNRHFALRTRFDLGGARFLAIRHSPNADTALAAVFHQVWTSHHILILVRQFVAGRAVQCASEILVGFLLVILGGLFGALLYGARYRQHLF
jgi:hypothetical protein